MSCPAQLLFTTWSLLTLIAVEGLRPGSLRPLSAARGLLAARHDVDVAVIGGGIAGTTISWLLSDRQNLSVALIDPRVDVEGAWYPNYGEWRDEWEALSQRLDLPELRQCTTTEWETTECFFGGSYNMPFEERTILERPYVRVDRVKMQKLLRGRYLASGGKTIASKLLSSRCAVNLFDRDLVHNAEGETLTSTCMF